MEFMTWQWWADTWTKLGTWSRVVVAVIVVATVLWAWNAWQDRNEYQGVLTREERCRLVDPPDFC